MRVLIAEDNVMMRRVLVRTLQQWDFDVVEAENGVAAWKLFQEDSFHLVVTDWVMPEMDGLDLIRNIRQEKTGHYVYILLLTAMSEKSDLVAGMEAGADDFLVKPVDHNELRVRLREGERIIRLERELANQNQQLRDTQAALVQSEKLAGLGQMAAGMAHELNNPIALVINNLAVLRRDLGEALEILQLYRSHHHQLDQCIPQAAAEIQELIERSDPDWILSEAPALFDKSIAGLTRIRDIVQNLRQFARLDEAELDTVAIDELLNSVTSMVRHEFDAKQVKLSVEYESCVQVECEPAKIQQVFQNLLSNALRASQQGDEVRLRTSADNDGVMVEVIDRGCGIAPKNLPHLFEPFFTTRAVGDGQGLGLATSHGIIRNHGGSIDVASEFGKGSEFRVQLPLRPPRSG